MILDMFSLKGRVAVVTGANTGLGQGMCVALAQAGADIVGVARRDCDETKTLVEEAGSSFYQIKADLSTMEPVEQIINGAVVFLNQKFTFFLCQAAAKQFIAQKSGGKIINIASMLSYQGGIRVPSYTASKSAVLGLTRAMANEWAKYNINVNGIAPGYMATNNTQALRNDDDRSDEILSRIPAGRWGTPADMAGAVVYLASAASDYVNGFTLAVDGGWLAR